MTRWVRAVATAGLLLGAAQSAFAWGAIAVDDEAGQSAREIGYGYVTGANNEAAAERGAMAECRKRNNKNCKVVLTFESCGAYAADRSKWGTAEGISENASRRNAIAQCGTAACKVAVSVCN
jgi:hypothetical protein